MTPEGVDGVLGMPAGAYGDSIGGMTIAGGISAALFAREQTGETSIIDVSLLSTGAWATALSVNVAMLRGAPPPKPKVVSGAPTNPLIGTFRTSDDRWIMLSMLQPGRYWPEFCRHVEREDLITDERFDSVDKIMANAADAGKIVAEILETRTFAEWVERFQTMEGQWAAVQNALRGRQ